MKNFITTIQSILKLSIFILLLPICSYSSQCKDHLRKTASGDVGLDTLISQAHLPHAGKLPEHITTLKDLTQTTEGELAAFLTPEQVHQIKLSLNSRGFYLAEQTQNADAADKPSDEQTQNADTAGESRPGIFRRTAGGALAAAQTIGDMTTQAVDYARENQPEAPENAGRTRRFLRFGSFAGQVAGHVVGQAAGQAGQAARNALGQIRKPKDSDEAPAETKPAEPAAETKPAEQAAEAKPAEPAAETKPAEQAAETKPAETAANTKPAEQAAETKPAEQAAETKPAEPAAETKPAEQAAETAANTKPAEAEQAQTGEPSSRPGIFRRTAGGVVSAAQTIGGMADRAVGVSEAVNQVRDSQPEAPEGANRIQRALRAGSFAGQVAGQAARNVLGQIRKPKDSDETPAEAKPVEQAQTGETAGEAKPVEQAQTGETAANAKPAEAEQAQTGETAANTKPAEAEQADTAADPKPAANFIEQALAAHGNRISLEDVAEIARNANIRSRSDYLLFSFGANLQRQTPSTPTASEVPRRDGELLQYFLTLQSTAAGGGINLNTPVSKAYLPHANKLPEHIATLRDLTQTTESELFALGLNWRQTHQIKLSLSSRGYFLLDTPIKDILYFPHADKIPELIYTIEELTHTTASELAAAGLNTDQVIEIIIFLGKRGYSLAQPKQTADSAAAAVGSITLDTPVSKAYLPHANKLPEHIATLRDLTQTTESELAAFGLNPQQVHQIKLSLSGRGHRLAEEESRPGIFRRTAEGVVSAAQTIGDITDRAVGGVSEAVNQVRDSQPEAPEGAGIAHRALRAGVFAGQAAGHVAAQAAGQAGQAARDVLGQIRKPKDSDEAPAEAKPVETAGEAKPAEGTLTAKQKLELELENLLQERQNFTDQLDSLNDDVRASAVEAGTMYLTQLNAKIEAIKKQITEIDMLDSQPAEETSQPGLIARTVRGAVSTVHTVGEMADQAVGFREAVDHARNSQSEAPEGGEGIARRTLRAGVFASQVAGSVAAQAIGQAGQAARNVLGQIRKPKDSDSDEAADAKTPAAEQAAETAADPKPAAEQAKTAADTSIKDLFDTTLAGDASIAKSLKEAGVSSIADLMSLSKDELLNIRGIGPSSVQTIQDKLNQWKSEIQS